ncbi:MAG: decaprenylphospho-beta-D-erythro-pentofuranosid-2-ulose 2-reductase [Acidimicrobiales bacterium]
MRDSLGRVASALVLGGRSEIGLAIASRLVADGCETVVLAARRPAELADVETQLRALGAKTVDAVAFDALDSASHPATIDAVFDRHGDIDVVIAAFGVLGDQATFDADPAAGAAAAQANYVGAVSSLLAVAKHLREQGHGTIVVLSSVAGERTRKANYVYGSSKAGLDAFAQGLGDALVGSGASVLVVRPGFVKGRMTAGMDPAPLATTPEAVADVVVAALAARREIVWAPGPLRWVMAVFRHLPRTVWRKVSARA